MLLLCFPVLFVGIHPAMISIHFVMHQRSAVIMNISILADVAVHTVGCITQARPTKSNKTCH